MESGTEVVEPQDKALTKDAKDIKGKIKLEQVERSFSVYAIIRSKTESHNESRFIPCNKGKHISQVVYDSTKDGYVVKCMDLIHVGEIFTGYQMEMEGVIGWKIDIPLPEVVLRRYLSAQTIKHLDNWKAKYDKDRYEIQFIQIINAY